MSKDWYARKVGNPQPATRQPTFPDRSQNPTQPVAPQQQAAPPEANRPGGQTYDENGAYTPRKASSSRETGNCPECGGLNYMGAQGHRDVAKRCYDCGYPVIQSTSGVSIPSDAPGHRAMQLDTPINNFHPQTIIGRVE